MNIRLYCKEIVSDLLTMPASVKNARALKPNYSEIKTHPVSLKNRLTECIFILLFSHYCH